VTLAKTVPTEFVDEVVLDEDQPRFVSGGD
jgi:hypothetical protein